MKSVAPICGVLVIVTAVFAARQTPDPVVRPKPPKLPFIEQGACPFEGCQYSAWTATKPTVVYDTWKEDRKQIARITKGEKVTGITGLVITNEPGIIRMYRDRPEDGLKRGDTILTYTYHGEGTSAVWFNGRYYADFDTSFARGPDGTGCRGDSCAATYLRMGKKVWWAKVRFASGRTGWVNMNEAAFEGVDALA